MAKTAKIAWGIDVGNCALKAIKLEVGSEGVEVLDFAVINHSKILSQPDLTDQERQELVSQALDSFLLEHETNNCAIVVSVPGQSSFARFIKLPPVEKKRIAEIVRYEAIQQIPFEIDDVEWDWQSFESSDSPEVEVGIFAIKSDLVTQSLSPFIRANCLINMVQMAPMALYNFLRYDQKRIRESSSREAIIALDIGAENTDLIIADGIRVWQRSIPIGGNQFTLAVQKAFKLSFPKAESIKRSASTSKYARQIFQAMRPVFADLAAEVQRSLGFYSSGNREVQFRELLAMGNAMKLPGLVKFLQQSLSLPIKRLDNFESLALSADISVTEFTAQLSSLPVAYGLALQGIGQGAIISNLLPRDIVRQTQWQRKRQWFIAACAAFLISGLTFFFQAFAQSSDIESAQQDLRKIKSATSRVNKTTQAKSSYMADINKADEAIAKHAKFYEGRNMVPVLMQAIRDCLPNEKNNPIPTQQKLYKAFNKGDRQGVLEVPRPLRQQIFLTSLKMIYTDDLSQDFKQITEQHLKSRVRTRKKQARPEGMGMGGMPGMGMGMGMDMGMDNDFGQGAGGMNPYDQPEARTRSRSRSRRGREEVEEEIKDEKAAGFVLVIEGSTPHEKDFAFLWPNEVGLDREQWGFFDRLMHLGKTDADIIARQNKDKESSSQSGKSTARRESSVHEPFGAPGVFGEEEAKPAQQAAALPEDVPSTEFQKAANDAAGQLPFETYLGAGKLERYFDTSEHDWIIGTSSTRSDQPKGLGIKPKEKKLPQSGSAIFSATAPTGQKSPSERELDKLIDPFTFETISETYMHDANGKIIYLNNAPQKEKNDYWFRVKIKIKLKQQPDSSDKKMRG